MTLSPRSFRSFSRVCLAACAAASLATSPALAQRGDGGGRGNRGGFGGGMGQLFQPEFMRRDLTMINDILRFDDTQATIAETILMDYETSFSEAQATMREQFQPMWGNRGGDDAQRQERRAVMEQMRAMRDKMREIRRSAEAGEMDEAAMGKIRAEMDAMREKMESLRPPRPDQEEMQAMMEDRGRVLREWRLKRRELRDAFMSGLQLMLSEEQVEAWPQFDRALRRAKRLPLGQLSGERVDLFVLVDQLDLELTEEQRWQVDELLNEYELSLDAALVSRDRHLEKNTEMFMAMFGGDETAQDDALKSMEKEMDLRAGVRRVNEQYVDAMSVHFEGAEMPAVSQSLRMSFHDEAFPRIFRPTITQRSFDVAKAFDDLSDETLIAVMGNEEGYLVELSQMNQRLIDVMRSNEGSERVDRIRSRIERMRSGEGFGRGRGGEDRPQSATDEAFDQRQKLDKRYRDQLESLLTPEQIAELPEWRERAQGRGNRFGGGSEADREARRARMLERFDADGDGELSEAEREAMRDSFRERRGRGQGRGNDN